LNPGHPTLEASTLRLGYRGGGNEGYLIEVTSSILYRILEYDQLYKEITFQLVENCIV